MDAAASGVDHSGIALCRLDRDTAAAGVDHELFGLHAVDRHAAAAGVDVDDVRGHLGYRHRPAAGVDREGCALEAVQAGLAAAGFEHQPASHVAHLDAATADANLHVAAQAGRSAATGARVEVQIGGDAGHVDVARSQLDLQRPALRHPNRQVGPRLHATAAPLDANTSAGDRSQDLTQEAARSPLARPKVGPPAAELRIHEPAFVLDWKHDLKLGPRAPPRFDLDIGRHAVGAAHGDLDFEVIARCRPDLDPADQVGNGQRIRVELVSLVELAERGRPQSRDRKHGQETELPAAPAPRRRAGSLPGVGYGVRRS